MAQKSFEATTAERLGELSPLNIKHQDKAKNWLVQILVSEIDEDHVALRKAVVKTGIDFADVQDGLIARLAEKAATRIDAAMVKASADSMSFEATSALRLTSLSPFNFNDRDAAKNRLGKILASRVDEDHDALRNAVAATGIAFAEIESGHISRLAERVAAYIEAEKIRVFGGPIPRRAVA